MVRFVPQHPSETSAGRTLFHPLIYLLFLTDPLIQFPFISAAMLVEISRQNYSIAAGDWICYSVHINMFFLADIVHS